MGCELTVVTVDKQTLATQKKGGEEVLEGPAETGWEKRGTK